MSGDTSLGIFPTLLGKETTLLASLDIEHLGALAVNHQPPRSGHLLVTATEGKRFRR